MIFMRELYDDKDRVKANHTWIWSVHAVSYTYVAYVYYFTDARSRERSLASKMWVPLDIQLTACIFAYFMFYYLLDKYGSENDEDESFKETSKAVDNDA